MKIKTILSAAVTIILLATIFYVPASAYTKPPKRQYYQLIVYHVANKGQEQRLDKYLSEAYLPALHRQGIKTVGVFKTANMDTATNKRLYVLIPFHTLAGFGNLENTLAKDKVLAEQGSDYINAAHDDAPYVRKESILMQAFAGMPQLKTPEFSGLKSERIYELRSYESATEKLYKNKVAMFNDAEMEIFERIGSQPVFYGEVIAGSRMPNLMYMTSYSSKASRDEQWKKFGNDPKWKAIVNLELYKNNMKKLDAMLLSPTAYSDF
jgi:hypothetical protein